MAKMPDDVKALLSEMPQMRLGGGEGDAEGAALPTVKMLATLDKDYRVNLVPVASVMTRDDESLMFFDMFMNKTKANLAINQKVSVTVLKPPMTGYQIKGTFTEWITSGPFFKMWSDMIFSAVPVSIRGIGIVSVDEVYSVSPLAQPGEN